MDKKEAISSKRPLILENNDFLFRLGIYIPGKENFIPAIIKYKNSDFVVEEIQPDNTITTIDYEELNIDDVEESSVYHLTLVKNGLKTTDAINIIANTLNIKTQQISYFGLKDDDAITSQRISIRDVPKLKIKAISSKDFFLKNIEAHKNTLIKGQNLGNRFSLILRSEKVIDQNILNLIKPNSSFQFLNFFYTQRFLFPRFSNFYWSIFILKKDPESALKAFLTQVSETESPLEKSVREAALHMYGNWKVLYDLFKKNNAEHYFDKELDILNALLTKKDIITALNTINDQVKIWLYSLSSWFFNHKITEYLKSGKEIPETLPMYLSTKISDYSTYKEFGEILYIYPPETSYLKHKFNIDSFGSKVHTKASADIEVIEFITPQTMRLCFRLPTGAYATSFLSHFLNLYSGNLDGLHFERDSFIKEITQNKPKRLETVEKFK